MYLVSNNYKAKIKEASRTFSIKVTIGDTTYTNADIATITLEGNIQPGQGFTIGNTTSKMLKITFINKDTLAINNTKLNLMVGVLLNNGTYEYIPFKNYNIDKKETNDFTTSITCYDNMILLEKKYVCSLTFPISLSALVNNILSGTGISCVTSLPNINIPSNIQGKTKREWIGYIASYLGTNAVINRDGNLEFKLLNDISSSYKIENGIFSLTKEQEQFKLEAVECTANNTDIISGSDSETASVTKFNNPWMDKARLDSIAPNIINTKYLGYSMKWQGDPALDIGDVITFTDKKGNEIVSPILNYKINLAGVTAEMSAKGETVLRNNTESTGTQQSQIDNINNQLSDCVTNDNLDSVVDAAIEDKDLVNNSDLDSKLGDYVTNENLQQELAKRGDNLVTNGDFDYYQYNPDGIATYGSLKACWKIFGWIPGGFNEKQIVQSGVDMKSCLYLLGYYGQSIEQCIELSGEEEYLYIHAFGKRADGEDLNSDFGFYYLFNDSTITGTDIFGESFINQSGNRLNNAGYYDSNITPIKSSKYDGWWEYSKVVKVPSGSACLVIGTCANDYEFYLDKVEVKVQANANGYCPSVGDKKLDKSQTRRTILFVESDWSTEGSSTTANATLSIKNPLQSTNINCSFVNDDDNCMELVSWEATTGNIIINNDRAFNGHVIIECFDR